MTEELSPTGLDEASSVPVEKPVVEEKKDSLFSDEEMELFGKSPSELSPEEQREQIALRAIKLEEEKEKAKTLSEQQIVALREADEKNRLQNAINFQTQFHLCTYCGGQKTKVLKGTGKQPRVVIGMEVPTPSPDGSKPPVLVCFKCLGRLFHNILGVPRFYGQEMRNLMGDQTPKGHFPLRKDGVS